MPATENYIMINESQEESGFCGQCGIPNPCTAAFCVKCGAPLPWAATKAETVAPQAVAPLPTTPAMPSASQWPPSPPPVAPVPPVTPSGVPVAGVPVVDGFKSLFKVLFPPELRAASKGATPQELLRLYGLRMAGLVLLLVLVKSYAYSIVSVLAVAAMVCLVVGLLNPQAFRSVFGAKTSKATVGWTFGIATLLLGAVGSNMEPKAVKPEPIVSSSASSPATAPVANPLVASVPTSAPVQKTTARVRAEAVKERAEAVKERADAAKERVARAQAKAQRELVEREERKRAVDEAFEPEITLTSTGVLIKNNSRKKWEACWVYINFHPLWGNDFRHLSFDFDPHESHEIAYSEFRQRSDSGTKIFSESGEKIKKILFTASVDNAKRKYEISVPN